MSKASYSYPPDEFDAPPDPDSPRGVHRAPRSAWSRWWPFVAVIVIVPLVAWAAVTYLAGKGQLPDIPGVASTSTAQATTGPTDAAQPSGSAQATAPAAPTTTAAPSADLATPVSVLNGSKIAGLAKKVGDQLTAVGFAKVTAGNATSSTPTASTVFYGSESLKATAELVAKTIKVDAVEMSATEAPSGITVVLRSDPSA